MHTHNKCLPTTRQLFRSNPDVSTRIKRKTTLNLRSIAQFEHHKELTERNKKRELQLKNRWPKGLVRFVPDWKGGFELGGGGPLGISTDDDGNQQKGNAACFGGMLRYHKSLITDEKSDPYSLDLLNYEIVDGDEDINPSGFVDKSYADTCTSFIAFLSTNPDHSSNSAIEFMEVLMNQPDFKRILLHPDVEIVEFKCDNGSHFISGETLHYAVVDLPRRLQPHLPNLKQVMFAPFTPRHGKTDLDRFFGWLTRHLEVAKLKYKVSDIIILKRAIDEGFERSKVERKSENKAPINQLAFIYELRKKAPVMEKRIHLPGIGSVGGVSFLASDNSIRNHVFADIEPEYGRDLRNMIIHTRRTDDQ